MGLQAKSLLTTLAIFFTIISLSTAYAADEPENVIKYRQNVMKSVGAHIANIAAVVKGEVTIMHNLVGDAQAIANSLQHVGTLFPAGTESGKTNAVSTVWSDQPGFNKALDQAQAAAQNMIGAATSNDIATIGGALGELGKSCKGCHKTYKKKK